MRRREFITILGSAAAAWPFAVRAQQSDRMRRIGFLRTAPPPEHELAAFLRALAERDYVQGRNFVLVTQWGDGDVERLSELAVGLVNQDVEIIVTEGTIVVRAVAAVTSTLPIVTTSAADPFMGGLIKSLSHPGGNVTGLCQHGKRHLQQSFRDNEGNGPWTATHSSAGNTLDLAYVRSRTRCGRESSWHRIQHIDMPKPEAADAAMREAKAAGAQGAVVRGSPFFSSAHRRFIVERAAEHRLPTIYERRDDTERGGLVSYAPNVQDQYRATAEYVVRILAGAKPGDLPIQQPTKFDLVINLSTAARSALLCRRRCSPVLTR